MLQIVLLAGKFVLLLILYVFIYQVVRSSTREFRVSANVAGRQFGSAAAGPVAMAQRVSEPEVAAPSGSNWALVVLKSPSIKRGETFVLAPGSRVVVGRAPEMDIYVDDTFVSSKHALFESVGGELAVEDLHSTNGTLVNGREISGASGLQAGDRVEIGDTVFEVEVR
jgi:hypothetical protein